MYNIIKPAQEIAAGHNLQLNNHIMDKHFNQIKQIWRLFFTILLTLFMLMSMNSLLPLKWQFPSWKLSPNLKKGIEKTAEGVRIDFKNNFSKTTVALDKNYATVVQTLDQHGNCILEQYFDKHGKPAVLSLGYSAIRRKFNEDGKWICTTYLDGELSPIIIQTGYSTVCRTYNTNGDVETETYYDNSGLPTPDNYSKYGIRYEYNEYGYRSTVICLDAVGNIINNKDHFAVIKRTYTSDGKLRTQMLYDKNGNPAILNYGQSGYLYENGMTICLDGDGKRMFVMRFFLRNSIPAVMLIGVLLILLILLSGRALTWILLLLYLFFIAYMTIINRETVNHVIKWSLPPNYYLFFANREILSNIWLFIPLGAILYKLSHMWKVIAFPIILTLVIETSQLIFDIGVFELSDLIANSLGGMVGIVIIYLLSADSTI